MSNILRQSYGFTGKPAKQQDDPFQNLRIIHIGKVWSQVKFENGSLALLHIQTFTGQNYIQSQGIIISISIGNGSFPTIIYSA